jgi:ssDNA-binding Zn-finger/Zn-ribbon topoisomerase 1
MPAVTTVGKVLLYVPMINETSTQELCPNCGSPLKEPEETKTGKKLQRCSKGAWNAETHQVEGCTYVKWLTAEPKQLDEKCPKCGSPLVLQSTRTGKKMKKCSTSGWDRENRVATGCDYVEWLNGSTEQLDEECPQCGEKLVLFTTNSGKKMKKCSTAGWDREFRQPTGCTFVQWM